MANYSDKYKKMKEINVNTLFALCEMTNYDNFCIELDKLVLSNGDKIVYKIYDVLTLKTKSKNKKVKQFIKKYQDIFSIMMKYNCLAEMTIYKYSSGSIREYYCVDYFYKYIEDHKDNIDQIKNLLSKIKSLEIEDIIFDENFDFTKEKYSLSKHYRSHFQYVDNIEILPSYETSTIRYKTTNSNYSISLESVCFGDSKSVRLDGRVIELNSLLFSPERLPSLISFETIVLEIYKKADELNYDSQILKDMVKMSVSIDDLIVQFNVTKRIIESLNIVQNKAELEIILKNILNEIETLKNTSLSIENKMVDTSEILDEEILEKEKKLYLKRREIYFD